MRDQDSKTHGHQDHGHDEKDPRDHPIEQTVVPTDPDAEPVPVGTPPKPPYEGPGGGGGDQQGHR